MAYFVPSGSPLIAAARFASAVAFPASVEPAGAPMVTSAETEPGTCA